MSTNVTNTVQSDETVNVVDEFYRALDEEYPKKHKNPWDVFGGYNVGRGDYDTTESDAALAPSEPKPAPKPKAPTKKPRFYDIKDKHGKVISPRRYGPRASGFDQRQLAAFNKGRFAKPQTVKCDTYLGEDGNKIPMGRLDMKQAIINHELGYWE